MSDEFNYSDMDDSDFSDTEVDFGEGEEVKGHHHKKGEPSDAELERILLENMTSEEEEEEEEPSTETTGKLSSKRTMKKSRYNNAHQLY